MKRSDQYAGKWISILYRHGQAHIGAKLAPLNIGRGQHIFLARLFLEDGVSQDDLTKELCIDKGTTARALSKLELAGYVKRRQYAADRRVKLVFLTKMAMKIEDELFSVFREWSDLLLDGMSAEERRTAIDLLIRMANNAVKLIDAEKE